MRAVARDGGLSLRTVQVWVARAGSERLDRVDWSDRPRGGRRVAQATSVSVEDLVLEVRRRLKTSSALGEFGALAIRRELTEHPRKYSLKNVPSLRTRGRILSRRGALDGGRRVRRPPPPKGWSLPRVAGRTAELDSGDFDARRKLRRTVIYIRRTNDHGEVSLLGHTFPLDATWPHRLVRCEVDLTPGKITSFKLRRREPHDHPKIKTIDYKPQNKRRTK